MLDEFRPATLSDLARELSIDPLEVMRLLVLQKIPPDKLVFSREQVTRLREALVRWKA